MTDPHRLRPAGILSALCAAALACSLGAPDNVPTPVVVSGLDATATGEPGPESGSERETSTPLQPTISATPALQVGMSVGTLQLGDVQASQTAIADSVPTLDEAAGEPYDPFDAVRAAFSIQRTIRAASADDRYLWSTIWCASDADVLATTLAQIRIDLTVEGRPLAIDRALRRTWAPDTGPQRCQSIDIAVAGWTSLRTHLETTITFGAPLDNGLAHYPAGRLTRRYEVLAPEATGEPNRYWLDGVAFTYRPDLAHSLDVRDVPEVLYGSPDVHLPGDIQPAYTEVQLNATDTREPYATRFVRVYDADALAALSVAARDGIESLRAFTASRPDTPTPAVAIGTSLPMFTGRVRSFTFNGGHGVSYLTQYGFMVGPITRDLVYVFQAVTDDGRFIHGEYPVQAAGLPADPMDPAANEAAMNDFDAYVADVRAKLDQLDPASFTPTITWLDEWAHSLEVTSVQAAPADLQQAPLPDLRAIDSASFPWLRTIGTLGRGQILDAQWLQDSSTLALLRTGGVDYIGPDGQLLQSFAHAMEWGALSADGRILAAVTEDRHVDRVPQHVLRLWSTETGRLLWTVNSLGFSTDLPGGTLSADGRFLLYDQVTGFGPSISAAVLDIATGRTLERVEGVRATQAVFVEGGERVVFWQDTQDDYQLLLWDRATGALDTLATGLVTPAWCAFELRVSADGRSVLAPDGVALRILDVTGQAPTETVIGAAAQAAPQDAALCAGDVDRERHQATLAYVFREPVTEPNVWHGPLNGNPLTGKASVPSAAHILYAPDGASVALWDEQGAAVLTADSLETRWSLRDTQVVYTSADLSPDGRWLAARTRQNDIQLWWLEGAWKEALHLPGQAIVFSADSSVAVVADSDALTRVTLADGVATVAGSWPLTAPFTSAQGLALSPDAHWLARVVSGELTIQDAVAGETRARVTDVQDIAPHRPLIFAVDGQSLQVPGVGRYDLDGQRLGDAVDGLFLSDDRGGIWRAIPESSDPDGRVAALERPATGETFNGPYPLAMSTLGHVPALVLSAGPRLLLAREWMLDLTDSLGHTQTRVLSVSPESWSGSAERHLVASANNGFISLWGVPQP